MGFVNNQLEGLVDLEEPTFQATGATGKITFAPNGDRHEVISQLVTVVKNKCQPSSYLFVPLNYTPAKYVKGNCPTETTNETNKSLSEK